MSNFTFITLGLAILGFYILGLQALDAQAKCERTHSVEVCFHTLR